MNKKPIKNLLLLSLFCWIIITSIYFYKFHNSLSDQQNDWSAFGCYVGGLLSPIFSLLALYGIFYSTEITKDQFRKQTEDSNFFSLLNIHLSKISNFKYTEEKGYPKELYEKIGYSSDPIIYNGYEIFIFLLKEYECFYREISNAQIDLSKNSDNIKKIDILVKSYDKFYHSYGHITGQYFRHIYYILVHAENSIKEKEYSKIFRAQLSNKEIALLFFNMMSNYTSNDFNRLLLKYNIFDDLHLPDISMYDNFDKIKIDILTRSKQLLKK